MENTNEAILTEFKNIKVELDSIRQILKILMQKKTSLILKKEIENQIMELVIKHKRLSCNNITLKLNLKDNRRIRFHCQRIAHNNPKFKFIDYCSKTKRPTQLMYDERD